MPIGGKQLKSGWVSVASSTITRYEQEVLGTKWEAVSRGKETVWNRRSMKKIVLMHQTYRGANNKKTWSFCDCEEVRLVWTELRIFGFERSYLLSVVLRTFLSQFGRARSACLYLLDRLRRPSKLDGIKNFELKICKLISVCILFWYRKWDGLIWSLWDLVIFGLHFIWPCFNNQQTIHLFPLYFSSLGQRFEQCDCRMTVHVFLLSFPTCVVLLYQTRVPFSSTAKVCWVSLW